MGEGRAVSECSLEEARTWLWKLEEKGEFRNQWGLNVINIMRKGREGIKNITSIINLNLGEPRA